MRNEFPKSRRHPFGVLLVCLGILVACESRGEEPHSHLVVGFERFARHGDIPPTLGGTLLLSELSCTACHSSAESAWRPKLGPRLNGAGNRLQTDWLHDFLLDPNKVKPGTTMPDLLSGLPAEDRTQAVRDLVAFLSIQQTPFPEFKASGVNPVPHEFWTKGDPNVGKPLYHQTGCVACHEPDATYDSGTNQVSAVEKLLAQLDPDEIADLGLAGAARKIPSIPLSESISKYSAQSLTHFLIDPHAVRPSGRMPNLKLTVVEAANIAAYLLSRTDQTSVSGIKIEDNVTAATRELAPEVPHTDQTASGKRWFLKLGCANCHEVPDTKPTLKATPLVALNWDTEPSCISKAAPGLPRYQLDVVQLDAIRAAIRATQPQTQSADRPEPMSQADQVQLNLLQMNCLACHEREQLGGVAYGRGQYFATVGHVDLGDEGRLPPPLTGVGFKLKPAWLKKVLQGTGDLRPHLQIRMPKYTGPLPDSLPGLLAAADSLFSKELSEKPSPETNSTKDAALPDEQALAEAGRQLFDLGCVQCHPIRGESLTSVVGVDVAKIDTRLNLSWFHQFLLDPARLKARTRMPTFFAAGSVNQEVLHGNAAHQIAAVWHYLKNAESLPLPSKIEQARNQNYELIPKDRPMIHRTFMQHAGTHAIAVGFPQSVHFAFDADQLRVAELWRGRFLDARATWADRFAPPVLPLGKEIQVLSPECDFAFMETANSPWPLSSATENQQFLGYRLDAQGVPVFSYQIGAYRIADRIEPSDGNGIVRTLSLEHSPRERSDGTAAAEKRSLWLRLLTGTTLTKNEERRFRNENGLTVSLAQPTNLIPQVRKQSNEQQAILQIEVPAQTVIRLEYQW